MKTTKLPVSNIILSLSSFLRAQELQSIRGEISSAKYRVIDVFWGKPEFVTPVTSG